MDKFCKIYLATTLLETTPKPRTRSDTPPLQDVAIAYGYNNMERQIPVTSTFGKELPLMQLTEGLRSEIKDYTESLTWALCSRAENFGFMNREDDGKSAVSIGNPATAEFEVCRTTLLPGNCTLLSPLCSPFCSSSGTGCRICNVYLPPLARGTSGLEDEKGS